MKHLNVLIVDPDREEREKNARVLSDARYTVFQAEGIAQAEGVLKRHRGRVAVLCELTVGEDSGLRFMQESLKKYPFLPFSFVASSPPLKSVLGALRQGAYDFLRKPIPQDILCHSVARSLQRLDLMLETERQEKEIRHLLARSREELKAAQDLSSFKGFMISMAAHDFRSIITVLDGYLQYIRDKCHGCDASSPAGILEQAQRTIGRLRTMANTLLDYESAERGRILVERKPFPVREVLLDCIAFYQPYAEQKEVDLDLGEVETGLSVSGDRPKVMEILDNLLYNALKFTPPRGTIRLGGRTIDGSGTIYVKDSGGGIPEDKLKNLFNQEAIIATVDSNARLGLGLAICKRLLEAQNGKIWIESELGKGTQVSFSLPLSR